MQSDRGATIHGKTGIRASAVRSKQLLEIAKTGVERAIEEDEGSSIAWMNHQLEALGVKLT